MTKTVVGIAGSLREGSLNRTLLGVARRSAPPSLDIVPHDLQHVPLYDGDIDGDAKPKGVTALRDAIARADGVLIASPEYNYGIPGVLKNTLDWVSRPAFRSPMRDKPVAIIGAAPGFVGTARAQQHLKVVLLAMGCAVLPWQDYLLGQARDRLATGDLEDERSRRYLEALLQGFEEWMTVLDGYGQHGQRRG